jgi:hypothetical protein
MENEEDLYFIRVFDDGNQKFKELPNKWIITSFVDKGKFSLKNINGKDIITNISSWKTIPISNFKYLN